MVSIVAAPRLRGRDSQAGERPIRHFRVDQEARSARPFLGLQATIC